MSDDQAREMRPETTSEHIARDMREGRFPEQSERQMVPVLASLPHEIQVWRSTDTLDLIGAWARTRFPPEAVTYVSKADAQAAVALMVAQAATQADPWDGPVTKNKIVDAQAIAAQQIKARIRALAPADGLAAVDALRAEIADLKMNMDADLRTMVREGQQLRTLAAELAAAQQREAELRGALEMSRQGWRNALELDLLPKQHRHSAKTMADIADAALASVDGLAMVQELRAERDSYRATAAQPPTDPGDGWTWNERLGWIGPDGKPADPRRRG